MRDELNALALDLLAAVGDAQARGLHHELAPLPEVAGQQTVDRWADTARGARTTPLAGRAGLDAVRAEMGDCKRCGLCKTRSNIVFGIGDPNADLVIVGEGPGQQEDASGEPFVGPAGQMLNKMLEHVLGLRREQVYILNVVKCRPPGNRNPTPEEVETCRPFLEQQLRALQPKVALVMGTVAYKTLMKTSQGIVRNRGRWHDWSDPGQVVQFPVMPTFHPAYLLRKPEEKRKTFADLKELRARYDQVGGKR